MWSHREAGGGMQRVRMRACVQREEDPEYVVTSVLSLGATINTVVTCQQKHWRARTHDASLDAADFSHRSVRVEP